MHHRTAHRCFLKDSLKSSFPPKDRFQSCSIQSIVVLAAPLQEAAPARPNHKEHMSSKASASRQERPALHEPISRSWKRTQRRRRSRPHLGSHHLRLARPVLFGDPCLAANVSAGTARAPRCCGRSMSRSLRDFAWLSTAARQLRAARSRRLRAVDPHRGLQRESSHPPPLRSRHFEDAPLLTSASSSESLASFWRGAGRDAFRVLFASPCRSSQTLRARPLRPEDRCCWEPRLRRLGKAANSLSSSSEKDPVSHCFGLAAMQAAVVGRGVDFTQPALPELAQAMLLLGSLRCSTKRAQKTWTGEAGR